MMHNIIGVCYKYAVELQCGLDKLCTLDPTSSTHLRWADGMWLIARMLADDVLHIARTLPDGA